MKRVYLMIVVAISFTACGGSSRDNGNNKHEVVLEVFSEDNNKTIEKIAIDINCVIPATIDNYIELVKGDSIVKKEENTTVSIYHDENSNKRVCLDYGEAYIKREER